MFEKEAEELFNKKPLGYAMNPELEIYADGFKKGYNKALWRKRMTKEKLLALLAEEYICNGKCQDDITRNYVHCYYEIDGETLTRKRVVLGYYKKIFLRDDEKLFVEKSKGYEAEHLPQEVIAWK